MDSPYPTAGTADEPSPKFAAERALLANAFLYPEWLDAIYRRTVVHNWADDDRHNLIYQVIEHLVNVGEHVDPVTVIEALDAGGALALAGGMEYLLDICGVTHPSDTLSLERCIALLNGYALDES